MGSSGRAMLRVSLVAASVLISLPAGAANAPATSAGPGRIVCRSASKCELSIGTAAAMRYHIDIAALPKAAQQRLVRHCKPRQKACVATVDGTEMGDPLKVQAESIKFYN